MIHPGQSFLTSHKQVETGDDVLAYVEFLRKESGLDGIIPVDLSLIFQHFQIPEPIQKPFSKTQGFLFDEQNGIIFINSNDPASRQKFTQAHELVELLFTALPSGKELGRGWKLKRPGGFKEATKEFLCNWAAASLLMPPDYITNRIMKFGINFECARIISKECEISLSAALVQIVRTSPGKHSIVLWTMKNKPSEIKNKISTDQLTLFDGINYEPVKKLRVEWSMGSDDAPFIPKDKSVEASSQIYQAWQSDSFTSGKERLCLMGRKTLWYQTENLPFRFDGETQVLSLISHL